MTDDKTDEIAEQLEDEETLGGTVDSDSDTLLTLDGDDDE